MDEITKLCECGCGSPAPIATKNHTANGHVKGQPMRYVKGHNIRPGVAPWWKGDEAGVHAMHTWLNKYYPKAHRCEQCGVEGPTDYALTHGRAYSRNRDDYRELCRRCHVFYDEIGYCRYWKIKRGEWRQDFVDQ